MARGAWQALRGHGEKHPRKQKKKTLGQWDTGYKIVDSGAWVSLGVDAIPKDRLSDYPHINRPPMILSSPYR